MKYLKSSNPDGAVQTVAPTETVQSMLDEIRSGGEEVVWRFARDLAQVAARISRHEGIEGHARTADIRLEKFLPDEQFKLGETTFWLGKLKSGTSVRATKVKG